MTDSITALSDQLHHFSHEHPLYLVHLEQPIPEKEKDEDEVEDEDEDEDKDGNEDKVDFVEEEHHHGGQCNMCKEQIWSFHLCYYYCKACDYSLHKFCVELPERNHPLHPGHALFLHYPSSYADLYKCFLCNLKLPNIYHYCCLECMYYMDIICATISEQKINHPSHPHQLARMFGRIAPNCVACGNKHEGVFFQCHTCPWFQINLDCTLLPTKLLIQKRTDGYFTHSHPLTLAYSFPQSEHEAKLYPRCRVCDGTFHTHLWIYKCDKCIYYVHVDCATSKREPFMSIFMSSSLGKTYKNFKDDEHPNLLHCPFQDEGDNLLKRHMSYQKEFTSRQHDDDEILNHSCHKHPLILFDKQALIGKNLVSLHDPIKRVQLLCDGCVKPIMTLPFYICCQYEYVDGKCSFVLHEWCAKLPSQIQDDVGHHKHTLFLRPKVLSMFFGVFSCDICYLPSNGFAYGCTMCKYYVDINCAFIPKEITHDAHPNHLLSKVIKPVSSRSRVVCNACKFSMGMKLGFHCPSCDFYIHAECALLLPRVIKHKCDKHPLSLRYGPVKNHPSEYFCEICECEDQLNHRQWYYHCTTCAQSVHAACAPLILQYEQAMYEMYEKCVYKFLNVKFGRTLKIKGHSHRLTFVQGIKSDDMCNKCHYELEYDMIFKCFVCKFALHLKCAYSFVR